MLKYFERKNKDRMYYTYILRCSDNSLYTGITNNLQRRMEEHFNQTKKCAKYTLRHTPKKWNVYGPLQIEKRHLN